MLDIFPSKPKDKDGSAKSDNYLTSEEKSLLYDLLEVNAATVLSFEIETDRIGEANLECKLEKLKDKGYIKVNEIKVNEKESYIKVNKEKSYKIFTPTWKTRLLRVSGVL